MDEYKIELLSINYFQHNEGTQIKRQNLPLNELFMLLFSEESQYSEKKDIFCEILCNIDENNDLIHEILVNIDLFDLYNYAESNNLLDIYCKLILKITEYDYFDEIVFILMHLLETNNVNLISCSLYGINNIFLHQKREIADFIIFYFVELIKLFKLNYIEIYIPLIKIITTAMDNICEDLTIHSKNILIFAQSILLENTTPELHEVQFQLLKLISIIINANRSNEIIYEIDISDILNVYYERNFVIKLQVLKIITKIALIVGIDNLMINVSLLKELLYDLYDTDETDVIVYLRLLVYFT